MDTQEILNKIAKLKNAIESEDDADTAQVFKKKLALLESQLADAEKQVEKEEKKIEAEEKKELSEAEKKIAKLKDALANEDDPEIKAKFEKKIKQLEGTYEEVKEEIKEEKKEVAEQKKEIKEAIKKVKSSDKVVRKTAIKKVKEVATEVKKTVTKKKKRKTKLKTIMSQLDALINKNKKLKSKYTTAYKKSGKTTDVERDSKRKAKPFGYRFVGKHDYRVPTQMQIKRGLKRGTIDYEARPNRSDVYPDRKVKLADGGMMADGGYMKKVDHTNPSGLTNEQKIKKLKEEIKRNPNFKDDPELLKHFENKIKQLEEGTYESSLKRQQRNSPNYELADGGMMARGGRVKKAKVGYTKEDKARKAKPSGWRWKEEAYKKRIIEKKQLYMNVSAKNRAKYPDLVYYEDRLNKSDKNPSTKYQSV